jgi:CBS domain-containing protein
MRAIEAGRRPPPTVPAGTPLHEVARFLASEGLRAVVVTDSEGGPAGIVTERDLVVRGLGWNLASETPVEAVMTSELVTASPAAPTRFAYRLLRAHSIRQVPLIEGGRVVGIVDRDDLVDEANTEVLADLRRCPRCQGEWLRPVTTAEATNFLCLLCRSCWHLTGGAFTQVETRTCSGCTEHNFCRFPLIDYGVDTARLPSSQPASANPCSEPRH